MTGRSDPVRIVLVEDSELDAELIVDELLRDGIKVISHRVEHELAFVDALERFEPDVILSDLSMPEFSGYRALTIARASKPSIPFLFVSGTIGEDAAVEALHRGAIDYVLKHNLARLAPAVRRAVAESLERAVRKRAEEDLVRAQRYESLALLASGLSHDLRNVLQPISMGAGMLAEDPREEVRKTAKLIADCTKRGLDIVASMLSFARGSRTATERVRLSGLLEALALLLRSSTPANVDLDMDCSDATLELDGNYTELQQCLLNLCLNAVQAMSDGGALRVETGSIDLDASFFAKDERAVPGRYAEIRIVDSGVGMTEDVRARLFEPFFTTKPAGTGLGLLSCRRIVANHNGFMRISSVPGTGTTFSIYMPLPAAGVPSPQSSAPPLGRGQVVMIVLEEASTLSLLGNTIESHGYAVQMVQSGATALQIIESEGAPDVVVMDAEMNLMTGVRTVAALIEHRFAGPVIMIATGGVIDRDDMPPLPRLRCIEKPVDTVKLLHVLAEELRDSSQDSHRVDTSEVSSR